MCKIAACPPPPFVTWAEGLSTETVGEDLFFWPSPSFGPKTGLNLSEDFFWSSPNFEPKTVLQLSEDLFFGLHLILGRKTDLVLAGKFSFWSLLFSYFLNFLAPFFRKSCTRYCLRPELSPTFLSNLSPNPKSPARLTTLSRWQHCVRFNRPEIWTSDLPL